MSTREMRTGTPPRVSRTETPPGNPRHRGNDINVLRQDYSNILNAYKRLSEKHKNALTDFRNYRESRIEDLTEQREMIEELKKKVVNCGKTFRRLQFSVPHIESLLRGEDIRGLISEDTLRSYQRDITGETGWAEQDAKAAAARESNVGLVNPRPHPRPPPIPTDSLVEEADNEQDGGRRHKRSRHKRSRHKRSRHKAKQNKTRKRKSSRTRRR